MLATGGMDHALRVYDLETRKPVVVFNESDGDEPAHWNRIYSVVWEPYETNLVYSGGWDKMVSCFDV